ncbi:DNA alkylation repair enzyme [uncultured archaeon]|nr:DNA alkylation repair enzyme [uncultured archaeon]
MSFSGRGRNAGDKVSVRGLKPERRKLLKGAASAEEIISEMKASASPANAEGMAKFGINPEGTLGIPVPLVRAMAKEIGVDHRLAQELWASGVHEARILACLIDDPEMVDERQMEGWARDFDSWDVCDQVCSNLFDRTRFAGRKAAEWTGREEEFVKRAGYVLMAALSVHDRSARDDVFIGFLPLIRKGATDDRNFVRKAVNWALRQIGKRNRELNRRAIDAAERIGRMDSASARWIAADALRELKSEAVQRRICRIR